MLFILILFFPLSGQSGTLLPAGALEQKATFTSGLEYNTNPNMNALNKRSVWQLNLTPRYKVSKFSDLNEWYADLGLRVVRSSDTQIVINRENPTADIGWRREFERGNFGLIAHYDEASSLVTELDETGLLAVDATRVSKSIQATLDYVVADNIIMGINTSLSNAKFTGASSSLIGSENASVGSNLSYIFNETLKSVSQVSWSKFTPDNLQPESKNLNFNTGFDWNYNENTDLGFRVGLNKISGQNSGNGWNALANYAYRLERSVTRLDASRSVAPSAFGQLATFNRISAAWNYDISDRSSMGLNYSLSRTQGFLENESTQYSANYNYELSERWRLAANASYREQSNGNDNSNPSTNAKVIGFTLSYDHPVF